MDLSASDLKSIGLITGAGALIGGAYGLASLFLRESTATVDFDPAVEALHMNRDLFALYNQLREYRSFSEKDFRQSVNAADELVLRQSQIEQKKILPSLNDAKDAFAFYNNASKCINKMKTKTLNSNPRIAAKIEVLHTKIHALLQTSFMAVNRSVRQ